MKIQLLAIGNELLNGKIQDLNAHWLASKTFEYNIQLEKVHLIEDDKALFNSALTEALKSADIVITSGGIGPTKDDMTKSFLADFFNKKIQFSEKALACASKNYQRYDREFDQEHSDYTNLPDDFDCLNNPAGFAPGLFFKHDKQLIFSLPGVPREFQCMFDEIIYPIITQHLGVNRYIKKNIIVKTKGIPEQTIFTKLCPDLWEKLEKLGTVSSLPHPMGVDIGVYLNSEDEQELDALEEEVLNTFKGSALSEHIWHIGPETLEEVIIQKAREKNLTIGFAESCTGGLCANRITDVSGSSRVFYGSIISYDNSVKQNILGVSEDTLINYGAVSTECAKEMAIGAQKNLKVDIAVSTTGIAGPTGGSPEKPVGTVGIGLANREKGTSNIYHFKGERKLLKFRFSQIALFTLLEEIEKK